ncbi:histidine kinase [Streptomyces sp. NBC_01014]|uniref:sensor histidine kinase n=1 Tax=Streptomyces sp. NBC_01014 TaxID=2903719 RepID=UPI003867A7FF|nr:histidine kinase [Streptomyces sp. NBC_01014]
MKRDDDRLLPVLLLCAQAAVWPGAALVRGATPPPSALLMALLVGGTVTAALAVRRARPVVTLVLVAAACALGAGPLPVGAMAVLGTAGVGLALFAVATGRDTFTALLCVTALALWQLVHGLSLHGLSDRDGLDLVLTALLYTVACGTGLLVRRSRHTRRTAELRLKRAETERHRLPVAERRRMERELHDVSAHHLTAVIVSAGAALELRDRRPELTDEALAFAVGTGRTVTSALGAVRAPAPSQDESASPQERLRELVDGFGRLVRLADCAIGPLPDSAVAEAAFGIVREALTNVARHAPGARTKVVCRYGDTRTDITVTNAPPPAGSTAHGAGLGGGRGQGFLRSRAREAGGTLSSGPTADGGWEVRAVLPGRTAAPVERAASSTYRLAQVVAAVGLCAQPLLPTLVVHSQEPSSGWQVPAGVLFALLAAAQAVTLLWLRRAPRAARGALLVLALLWPVAMSACHYGGPVLLPPALGALATCAALAADASRARPSRALPLLAVVVHATAATAAVLDRGTTVPVWEVVAGTTAGAVLAVGAAHLGGIVRGRRERAARGAYEQRTAAWTEAAVRDAWAERRRIAAGLETTVLSRTAEMVAEAEAGRLEATADRARAALTAMRALLDTARDGGEGGTATELRPTPTLQALDLLAHQTRATGRDVEIRLTSRVPDRLPAAVDLTAYYAAETLLAVGGDAPAVIEIDTEDAALKLTATGVPPAAHPAVRERLAARVAALGGTLITESTESTASTASTESTGPPGTARLLLPLGADVASAREQEDKERD